jgi:hypothetical protein
MSLGLGLKLPVLAGKRPLFGSTAKAIKRYITELSAAGSMYDQFSSPITLDGDFEKQIQYVTTETGVFQMLSGLLSSTSEYLGITAAGDLELRLSGSFHNFGAVPRDGRLNTVRLVRVGSSISAYINGALLSSIVNSSTYRFDVVARYASGLYFNGIWSNLLVEDNGTLIVDAKKDGDGTSNVIVNDAAVLGSELWVYDPIVVDGSVVQYGLIAESYGAILPEASNFLVEVTWINLTGRLGLRIGDDSFNTDIETGGTGTGQYLATTNTLRSIALQDLAGGSVADSVKITVKEIPAATPYLTRVNQTTHEVTLYTEVDNGWLSTHDYWTYGPSISTGSEGVGQLIAGSTSDNAIIADHTYRYSVVASGITSGEIRYQLGASDVVATSVDGSFEGDHTVVSNDSNYVRVGGVQCNAGASMAVNTKRFLEVAS